MEKNKYKKEYADKLPDMFRQGESIAEIAASFNICRATFYNWVDNHIEFKEAYALGKIYSEAWWEKAGRGGAVGKIDINPSVWIANMRNKFNWDRKEPEEGQAEEKITKVEIIRRVKTD